jgi:hypothetical protein
VRVHVRAIDRQHRAIAIRRFETQCIEQPLHHRVQSTRADVFLALVDPARRCRRGARSRPRRSATRRLRSSATRCTGASTQRAAR